MTFRRIILDTAFFAALVLTGSPVQADQPFGGGIPAECDKAEALKADLTGYYARYDALTGKYTAQAKRDLKKLIASTTASMEAAVQACGPCSKAAVQSRLDNNETPFDIYKSCNSLLPALYRKNYQGGLIAYLDTTNGSGIVAAPGDQSSSAFWNNMMNAYVTTNANGSAIGTGKTNTSAILGAQGAPAQSFPSTYNYAAYLSVVTTINGYNDWVLPSKDEMAVVLQNAMTEQDCKNSYANVSGIYWTSTEASFYQAWFLYCADGTAWKSNKGSANSVRLIRYFTDTTPVLTTTPPTIASGSISSGGNISNDRGATIVERGICFSTHKNPTILDSVVTSGSGTGSYGAQITGLQSNTTYYVRAYAKNSVGDVGYGDEAVFYTLAPKQKNIAYVAATKTVIPKYGNPERYPSVGSYSIADVTGAVTALAPPVSTLLNPTSLAVDPAGRSVYVGSRPSSSEYDDGYLSRYSVNRVTGALTPAGSSVVTGSYPIHTTVDPIGRFVYTANYWGDSVSMYSVNPATGQLTAIAGSPLQGMRCPQFVQTDPAGRYLYVVNRCSGNVLIYAINPNNGALTPAGGLVPYADSMVNTRSITFDAAGRFAYVLSDGRTLEKGNEGELRVYSVDPSTGALSIVPGANVAAGNYPRAFRFDPTGRLAYLVGEASVSVYTANATTGVLTQMGSSLTVKARSIKFDGTGTLAYLYGWSDFTVYLIDTASGALVQTGSAFAPGGNLDAMAAGTTFAPMKSALSINGGAPTTNSAKVHLTASATESGVAASFMSFSNDNVTWSAWETYVQDKTWMLTAGKGNKTVYARFADALGYESRVISASVTLQ